MKTQLNNRLSPPLIIDVLGQFNEKIITADDACEALGIGKSRLYLLRGEYLCQRAAGRLSCWIPGSSGGDHAPGWPAAVETFLEAALNAGYSYAFAASEAGRKFGFSTQRSQVRHWAIREGLRRAERPPRLPAHTRRWQRSSVGELWQLDAVSDRWFGPLEHAYPLLDMVDDSSRMQIGCAIYSNENIPAYLHFLHGAFMRYGLPLEIYVDQAGIFRGNKENSVTRLQQRLMFYGVSFKFANSPEAKGKVERRHQVWQDRLPSYFALNGITARDLLQDVNAHILSLSDWRNAMETHREIGMTPHAAWDKAVTEGRSKLRPVPQDDPWWEYVWSTWHSAIIGPRGYVDLPFGKVPTQGISGSRATICEHLDGTYSVIRERPKHGSFPAVLFTNRPK